MVISKVALLDIDEKEGDKATASLVESFSEKRESIVFRVLDVTNRENVAIVTKEFSELFGDIDILIIFAGIVNSV